MKFMKIFSIIEYSICGIGVNFEHIGAFHAKWKLSVKSHG
jgi:hypothetical protein